MNTKGHHAIATEAGEPKLKDAFNSACQPGVRLGSFYFGNWLTDVSQAVDHVAYDGFEHKAGDFINQVCASAKDVCRTHAPLIDKARAGVDEFLKILDAPWSAVERNAVPIFGTERAHPHGNRHPRQRTSQAVAEAIEATRKELLKSVAMLLADKGELEATFRRTFEISGYFKFVHPVEEVGAPGKAGGRTIDFEAFLKVFQNRYSCYYPHEHLDRPEILGASMPGKPQYESEVDSLLGIYKYMHDHIEIAAGIFAQLDLEWAPLVFRPGPPIDDRCVDFNTRLAELGHGLHLVEDFFAHSNFCEHAAQSLGSDFVNWKTVAADRQGIFRKRLMQQLHPGWEDEDMVREEPNVVTGFFDIKDTLVSLTHVAEEFLGEQEWLEDAGEFMEKKLKRKSGRVIKAIPHVGGGHETLGDKAKGVNEKVEAFFKALNDPKTAATQYQELIHQTLETFAYWPDLDNESLENNPVAQKLLEKDKILRGRPIDPAVSRALLEGLDLPPVMADHFVEMVELWTRTKTTVKLAKGGWNLYKAFKTLCEFIAAPEIVIGKLFKKYLGEKLEEEVIEILAAYIKSAIYVQLLGSQRLGCHSLLAKDTGTEPLAEYAAACARAVHAYVIETLTRWAEPGDLNICRMPTSGSPFDHINTVDTRPWIDWEDLLFFHLRHPVKATPDQRPPTVVEISVAHECTGEETLGMLVLKYRPTAVNPSELTVESICAANLRMHIPVSQFHRPPRGVALAIPGQKLLIDHRDPLNRHRAWWRPIFETKDWTSMGKHDSWHDEVTKQAVAVSYHAWLPVHMDDVQELAVRAYAKGKKLEAKYVPPVACIAVPAAAGSGSYY